MVTLPNNHFDAIIIGGGIAGTSVAYSLSKRKIKTLLLERKEDLALEASGNPTGLVYPQLTKHPSTEGNFSLHAFRHMLRELQVLCDDVKVLDRTQISHGVFIIPKGQAEKDRYLGSIQAYNLDSEEMEMRSDSYSGREGFLFKKAFAISPRSLAQAYAQMAKPFTEFQFYQNFRKVEFQKEIHVSTETDAYTAKLLFLCHANSFLDFPETNWIPIRKVRGQLLWLPISEELKLLPHSYLFGDYLTKDIGHGSVLGASFDEYKMDESAREAESLSFISEAINALPPLQNFFNRIKENGISKLKTRVSFRSQSKDRRPIFGKLPDFVLYENNLPAKPSANFRQSPDVPYFENAFLLGALGSRGLTHALLASEEIVRDALGEKQLMNPLEYSEFNPERFLLRNWKRGKQ